MCSSSGMFSKRENPKRVSFIDVLVEMNALETLRCSKFAMMLQVLQDPLAASFTCFVSFSHFDLKFFHDFVSFYSFLHAGSKFF